MAPPSSSQPEAANFPMQTYTFNSDKDFFQPPKAYPEPPKDMWYEVPTTKPNPPTVKPKPIFPWENRQDARPTRRFAEDLDYIDSNPLPGFTIPSADYTSSANSPIAPIITVTHEDPWQGFGEGSKNAWDDVQGIDSYIRALNASQTSRRRSSFQVVQSPPDTSERRESLILTDFPSEMDRPSLPVTPAPIHRPNFWAGERNDTLPAADGVPNQADWVCLLFSLLYPTIILTSIAGPFREA
jgi:glycogenin glucosyltransferase